MSKPKQRRTKRHSAPGPRLLVLAWVQPATRRALERLVPLARRLQRDPDYEAGDIAGRLLDVAVPIIGAAARKKERARQEARKRRSA